MYKYTYMRCMNLTAKPSSPFCFMPFSIIRYLWVCLVISTNATSEVLEIDTGGVHNRIVRFGTIRENAAAILGRNGPDFLCG